MTTIAYKDGVVAYDSLVTADGMVDGSFIKARKINGLVVACAGGVEDISIFTRWVQDGMDSESVPNIVGDSDLNFEAIVVDKNGVVTQFSSRLVPFEIESEFYALGSGRPYAVAAMMAGASAKDAVKISCKLDVYSGGKIKTIRI